MPGLPEFGETTIPDFFSKIFFMFPRARFVMQKKRCLTFPKPVHKFIFPFAMLTKNKLKLITCSFFDVGQFYKYNAVL